MLLSALWFPYAAKERAVSKKFPKPNYRSIATELEAYGLEHPAKTVWVVANKSLTRPWKP